MFDSWCTVDCFTAPYHAQTVSTFCHPEQAVYLRVSILNYCLDSCLVCATLSAMLRRALSTRLTQNMPAAIHGWWRCKAVQQQTVRTFSDTAAAVPIVYHPLYSAPQLTPGHRFPMQASSSRIIINKCSTPRHQQPTTLSFCP